MANLVYISIHALREEGDALAFDRGQILEISIHALREGGRRRRGQPEQRRPAISIHALREEGDS